MEIIVGCIISKDDKILMVQEAKERYCGKWSFPSGCLRENEDIFTGAIRLALETTGHKVLLNKMLPIRITQTDGKLVFTYTFLGNILDFNYKKYNEELVSDKKFISVNEIRKMGKNIIDKQNIFDLLDAYENNKIFELDQIFI